MARSETSEHGFVPYYVECNCDTLILISSEEDKKRDHCPGCGAAIDCTKRKNINIPRKPGDFEPYYVECGCDSLIKIESEEEAKRDRCPACGAAIDCTRKNARKWWQLFC